MFITEAFAQAGDAAGGSALGSGLEMLFLFAPLMVVWYFFLIRPQSKQMKEHKAMISSLKKGDAVVTSGGVLGRVHAVAEKLIVVEIAPSVRLRMLPSSISSKAPEGLLEEEAKAEKSDEKK